MAHKCPWYEQIPDISRALAQVAGKLTDAGDRSTLIATAYGLCTAPGIAPHTTRAQWGEIAKGHECKLRYLDVYNLGIHDDIATVIELIGPHEAELPIGAATLAIALCLALIVWGTVLTKCWI